MNQSQARTLQVLVLFLLAGGLIALALGGYVAPLSRYVLTPVVGAQTWLATRFTTIQTALNTPADVAKLRQRNTDLEAEVARLQVEIIDLKQQNSEARILSALVDFARVNPEYRYTAATVIGRDPSPFMQYVIINRGSDDGLRRAMPVVTQQGLVGRVAAVTSGAARVQLITDASSSVNARIDPARVQAVLHGQVTGDIQLDLIPQVAKIAIGDLVLTSGLGGNYPANILIGQVNGVRKRENDLFQQANIQSVVNFSQIDIVLVITNFRPVDTTPLIPTPSGP
jgi:rod shape-determining protein MreC